MQKLRAVPFFIGFWVWSAMEEMTLLFLLLLTLPVQAINFAMRGMLRVLHSILGGVPRNVYAMEGSGLNSRGMHVFQTALTFGAVATITATEQSMVVPALPQQIPLAQAVVFGTRLGAPQAGIAIAHCRIIDATHIGVTWVNPTAGPVTPTAGDNFSFAILW